MPAENLYQQLKSVLQDFKNFLDANIATIKPAIQALRSIVPQITDLIDKLIDLMTKLQTEIQNLNVSTIPGLSQAAAFTQQVKTFLQAAESLLPNETDSINQVLAAADVVGGLPSLDQVKGDILTLIGAIIADLNQLKS